MRYFKNKPPSEVFDSTQKRIQKLEEASYQGCDAASFREVETVRFHEEGVYHFHQYNLSFMIRSHRIRHVERKEYLHPGR